MLELLLVPLSMAGLAVAMLGLAWVAFGEYRKLFLANPKLLMSLDVFAIAAEVDGPGYIAATLAFCGVWLLVLATIIGIVGIYVFLR